MKVTFDDCIFGNCGTAIKATGNHNLQINKLICTDNERDIELALTENSEVKITNFTSIGAKLESINITEYRSGIDAAKERIAQLPLSSSDREFILKRLRLIEANKDVGLLQRVLREIIGGVKSVSGNVVANIIATQFFQMFK